ncbi:MAG: hypothetical protein KA436_08610 [Oligoflexales bacterium]|nr:hypothetical protein [Oligoflexales bacterium]
MKKKWIFFLFLLPACVSTSGDQPRTPPQIDETTPLKEAVEAAVDFGEDTLRSVQRQISRRKKWDEVGQLLQANILKHHKQWTKVELLNAMNLYVLSQNEKDSLAAPELFKVLVRAESSSVQEAAWELASKLPSSIMAREIESKLTESLLENELDDVLVPKMADAVAANDLNSSYSILKQGLFQKGDVSFARGMTVLDPKKSAEDFLDYLAQAPIEELRQLNLKSVDLFSCMLALQHLLVQPVSVSHPHFDSLFQFAISRNSALAELSRKILDIYFPKYAQSMAFLLARQPTWIQVAFIEKVRSQMTPIMGVFLSELRESTTQKEVIEEIKSVRSELVK